MKKTAKIRTNEIHSDLDMVVYNLLMMLNRLGMEAKRFASDQRAKRRGVSWHYVNTWIGTDEEIEKVLEKPGTPHTLERAILTIRSELQKGRRDSDRFSEHTE